MIEKIYELFTKLGLPSSGHDKMLYHKGYHLDELPLNIAYKERFDFFDLFSTILGGWTGMILVGVLGL